MPFEQAGFPGGGAGAGGAAGITDPLTTKGDLWGFSTTDARVPIGSDGSILVADSAQALGVRWKSPPAALAATVNINNVAANTFTTILSQTGLNPSPPAGTMWTTELYGDLEVSVNTTNVTIRLLATTVGGVAITTGTFLGSVLGSAVVRGVVIRGHWAVEDATHMRGTLELHADTGTPSVLSADDLSVPNQTLAVAVTTSQLASISVQIAWTAGPAATNVCNFYTGNIQQVI